MYPTQVSHHQTLFHAPESFLVKQTESHVIVLLFRLGLLGGSSGCSISSCRSSGNGELAGVSQELLQLLSLLEGDLGDGSHGQEVLHTVGNGVRSAGHGWVSNLQTHSSNIGNSCHEHVLDVVISDVQDGGVEDGALVIHLLDEQTIGEGGDLQHVQQSCLGSSDLVTNSDDGHILNDLNGTLGNLGWDLQSLEE